MESSQQNRSLIGHGNSHIDTNKPENHISFFPPITYVHNLDEAYGHRDHNYLHYTMY